jgi:hypothetical protein
MSTPSAPIPPSDDRLLQLVRMAHEAEQFDAAFPASHTANFAAVAGEPVIARIGPADADSTALDPREIERLVSLRLGQLPSPPRAEPNRGLWTGIVAASICMGLMLWAYRGAPLANQPPHSAGQPQAERPAPVDPDPIIAPPGFERPLAEAARQTPISTPTISASGLQLVSSVPVFVVLKQSNGACGCAHLLPEQVAQGWTAPPGTRVLYARNETASARTASLNAADQDFPVRGQPLSASDFACFHANFATSLSQSIRGDASAAASGSASCDGSTTGPMLQASDFLCFTSKFAAGCM